MTEAMGCLKIVMKGRNQDGKDRTYIFSMSSRGHGMGEGTGIPAALGAMLMAQGKITEKGSLPPEACVNPFEMIELAKKNIMTVMEGGEGLPLVVEKIDENGNIEEIDVSSMF